VTQPRPYEVDAAELARRWTELIRPRLFRRAQPATDPIALFIGAQAWSRQNPNSATNHRSIRPAVRLDRLRRATQVPPSVRRDHAHRPAPDGRPDQPGRQHLGSDGHHRSSRRPVTSRSAAPTHGLLLTPTCSSAPHARAMATAKGRRVGRPSVVSPNQLDYVSRLRDEGLTIAEIVEKTGITRTSLYRPGRPSTTPETPPADPDRANLVSRRGTCGDATYKSVRNRRVAATAV